MVSCTAPPTRSSSDSLSTTGARYLSTAGDADAGTAPPVGDERDALQVFLDAFLAVAFGLTDDQARTRSTVSALSSAG